jgi:hypothetical protein
VHYLLRPRALLFTALLGATLASSATLPAQEPAFRTDFEQAATGKLPENMMVLSGDFQVQTGEGKKYLELPGSPLETFGVLFGPAQTGEASASASFYGTKQGRKFPAFGISLGGVSGYRLEMSGGKKALEIFKGDESRGQVPYEWTSGGWTMLRLQLRKTPEGTHVEGKAWPAGTPEPEKWALAVDDKSPVPAGRAAVWGAPYAGTPIRFDDLQVGPVK